MEKRAKRTGKTTTTASKRAKSTEMEAGKRLGKTTRSKSAGKTTRSHTTKACK